MRYVRLGKTELEVSAVALGTWAFGGDWGAFDEGEARATIERAVELGITLFDTAQAYGFGVSERLLGDTLWGCARREDVVVATKGGLRMDGDRLVRDASARWLRQGCEESLRNLGTDYVDLYQVHWPDPTTPPEETAAVLDDLVREGKTRHVGVSNFDAAQLAALGRAETLQPPYHLFHRDIEEEVLPYAAAHDLGVLAYGPLAHGLLGGHLTPARTFAEDDWRHRSSDFTGRPFAANLEVVERLRTVADEQAIPLPQLAVAWVLARPEVQVAIVGARRPAQLVPVAPAAAVDLDATTLAEIERAMTGAVPVAGPSPEGM